MAAVLGRVEQLAAFLADAEATQFAWATWDCMTTLANWAQRLTGIDPAANLRGLYDSEEGWRRIAAERGGQVQLLADCAGRAGMIHAVEPLEAGDVALVKIPRHEEWLGGIYTADGRFAVKTKDGLVTWRASWARPAWRLP